MSKTASTIRWILIVISVVFIFLEGLNALQNDFHPSLFILCLIVLIPCVFFEWRSNVKKNQKPTIDT